MKELVIHTDAGNLDLTPATPDELKHIAAEWPMGVILNRAEAGPNGLVFQIGKEEAYGVKLQPPDTDEPTPPPHVKFLLATTARRSCR